MTAAVCARDPSPIYLAEKRLKDWRARAKN
jgi:hypothetical protein